MLPILCLTMACRHRQAFSPIGTWLPDASQNMPDFLANNSSKELVYVELAILSSGECRFLGTNGVWAQEDGLVLVKLPHRNKFLDSLAYDHQPTLGTSTSLALSYDEDSQALHLISRSGGSSKVLAQFFRE